MIGAGTLTMSSTAVKTSRVGGQGEAAEDAFAKDSRKKRMFLLVGLAAALLMVVVALVIVVGSSEQTGSAPAQAASNGGPAGAEGAPALSATARAAEPAPSPSGTAKPLEIELPDSGDPRTSAPEQPAPRGGGAPSPKQAASVAVPSGRARLVVSAKGGSCKVMINLVDHGTTPVDTFITPGPARVYCRLPTGSTKRAEVQAVEGKTTYVPFDVKAK